MRFLLLLFVFLLLEIEFSSGSDEILNTNVGNRVNCHPEPDETKEECNKRKCIWDAATYAVNLNLKYDYSLIF